MSSEVKQSRLPVFTLEIMKMHAIVQKADMDQKYPQIAEAMREILKDRFAEANPLETPEAA